MSRESNASINFIIHYSGLLPYNSPAHSGSIALHHHLSTAYLIKRTPFFPHRWAYFVLPLLVYAIFSSSCLPFSTTIHLKAPSLDGSRRPLWRWRLRRTLSPVNQNLQLYFPRLLATGLILFRVAQ